MHVCLYIWGLSIAVNSNGIIVYYYNKGKLTNILKTMSLYKEILQKHEEKTFLFTKIRQNRQKSRNESMKSSRKESHQFFNHGQEHFDISEIAHQLEMLKLQFANEVAQRFLATGKRVKQIMKEIDSDLEKGIMEIVQSKDLEKAKDREKEILSTAGFTSSCHTGIHEETAKKSTEKTPTIIEFTLGNRHQSSGKTELSGMSGSDVSQFSIGNKSSASRNIKQKVMRCNNSRPKKERRQQN